MSGNKTILFVEDEENIAYALKLNLEAEGYRVEWVATGGQAMQILKKKVFDMILLDVMLPEVDGVTLCTQFRDRDKMTPIIIVSALGDTDSRIKGLKAGADDYINKPYDINELLIKINRLIYKNNTRSTHDITYIGNAWIDFTTQEAKNVHDEKVHMSKLEFGLAKLLIENENKALSRKFIYKAIWGYGANNLPNSRTLDNFIVFLRKYFELDPSHPKHFLSVRGTGYKYVR